MSNQNTLYVPDWLINTKRDQFGWPVGLTPQEKQLLTENMKALLELRASVTMFHAVEVAKCIGNGEFRRFDEPFLYAAVDRAMRAADAVPGWCIKGV